VGWEFAYFDKRRHTVAELLGSFQVVGILSDIEPIALQIGGRFNAANVLLALVAFFFLSVDLETI
jgi:UDP-N-acetylmuramyl tripeptide synthase